MFAEKKVKIDTKNWDFSGETVQPMYNLVTVLRVRSMGTKQKKIASLMEHHTEQWKARDGFVEQYKSIVDYAINTLKIESTENEILEIISNSYTNDFSQTLPNGNQV